jgi:hypothetical protein
VQCALTAFPSVLNQHAHRAAVCDCASACAAVASVVHAGAGPQRDCSGSQLCEQCGSRLNRCKGEKHRSGAGHVCQRCYDNAKQEKQKQQLRQPATPVRRVPLRDTPLLQSPERLIHLKDTVHTAGIGQQGRSRSADQNAMMLMTLHEMGKLAAPGTPPNQIITATAKAHAMSANSVEVPTQLVRDIRQGSRIIYTPPYESWLQPIELVWNQAKQQVAHGARRDRKLPEMEAVTKTALKSITGDACTSTIQHVHRFIDSWLKTVDAGWLRRFGSLDLLVAASGEEREAAYRRFMNGDAEVGSSDCEKENQPAAAAADDSECGRGKRRKTQGWHSTDKSKQQQQA